MSAFIKKIIVGSVVVVNKKNSKVEYHSINTQEYIPGEYVKSDVKEDLRDEAYDFIDMNYGLEECGKDFIVKYKINVIEMEVKVDFF